MGHVPQRILLLVVLLVLRELITAGLVRRVIGLLLDLVLVEQILGILAGGVLRGRAQHLIVAVVIDLGRLEAISSQLFLLRGVDFKLAA